MEKINMGDFKCDEIDWIKGIIVDAGEQVVCFIELKDGIISVTLRNSLVKFAEVNVIRLDEILTSENKAVIIFAKI